MIGPSRGGRVKEVLGPQIFIAGNDVVGKRRIQTVMHRETFHSCHDRQAAFADDQAYIEANLKPGEPKFFTQVTIGA
jgi:hypothetical protein